MSWITWVAVLVAWPLVGLAVAYLFGRFTHGGEVSGELASPVVSYLRHVKRAKTVSHATAHTKAQRAAAGARRSH